jgi:hypothetical protein
MLFFGFGGVTNGDMDNKSLFSGEIEGFAVYLARDDDAITSETTFGLYLSDAATNQGVELRDVSTSGSSGLQGSTFGLTATNSYNLSFDLILDSGDDLWDVTGLTLTDTTGSSIVQSIASITGVAGSKDSGIITAGNAYAFLGFDNNRGVDNVSDITVTAIPEPSSLALALVAGLGILTAFRRLR